MSGISALKDYYFIMGISTDASQAAVKKAYRKLAMQYHPDKNSGCKKAEAKFKDLNEANEILSDVSARRLYDYERRRNSTIDDIFEKKSSTSDSSSTSNSSFYGDEHGRTSTTLEDFLKDVVDYAEKGYIYSARYGFYKSAIEFAGDSPSEQDQQLLDSMKTNILKYYLRNVDSHAKSGYVHSARYDFYKSAIEFAGDSPSEQDQQLLDLSKTNILKFYLRNVDSHAKRGYIHSARYDFYDSAIKFAGDNPSERDQQLLDLSKTNILKGYLRNVNSHAEEGAICDAEKEYDSAVRFAGDNPSERDQQLLNLSKANILKSDSQEVDYNTENVCKLDATAGYEPAILFEGDALSKEYQEFIDLMGTRLDTA